MVWAGDQNAGDKATANLAKTQPSVDPETLPETSGTTRSALDFLAVIDVTKGSRPTARSSTL